jgi:hypothetical protein
MSRQFERIADHAEKISRFVLDPDVTVPTSVEDRLETLASRSRDVIDTAADVMLANAGFEAALGALTERDQLRTELENLDKELYAHEDSTEAYVVGLILDSIRRTAEYGANIAEVGIEQVARNSETSN